MALFTDGPPASVEDLAAQDSQILNVAIGEGIDVTQKLALAYEELGLELTTLMRRPRAAEPMFWLPPSPDPRCVAVTTPVKLWHAFRSLELVYVDAYNNQLNDRYAGKRDQYHERARWAHERLVQSGLGIVQTPVAKAATPNVTTIAGGIPGGTYYVSMAWVNSAGEEGASAPPAATSPVSGTVAVQPGGSAPENATGWNVYLGIAPGSLVRQNATPLAAADTWVQPNRMETTGPNPGGGQKPSYMLPIPRMLWRG